MYADQPERAGVSPLRADQPERAGVSPLRADQPESAGVSPLRADQPESAGVSPLRADQPMVSCICPTTAARRAWLPRAIVCFQRQTYANRELVIVHDAGEDAAAIITVIPSGDPRIRLVQIGQEWRAEASAQASAVVCGKQASAQASVRCARVSLGTKRNVACDVAAGDVIAHWDDDDWSEPGRLAYQVEALARSGKSVHGFHGMKFLEVEAPEGSERTGVSPLCAEKQGWYHFEGEPGLPLGTSLVYRREYWQHAPFPAVASGEDGSFAHQADSRQELVTEPDRLLMYATIHPGNTSPRATGDSNWKALPGFRWPYEGSPGTGVSPLCAGEEGERTGVSPLCADQQ